MTELSRSDLVVVANRLPVRLVRDRREQRWERSPGGLVAALTPALAAADQAIWVGWPGTATVGTEPFDVDGLHLVPIALTRSDLELFYEGFSNGTLWPLYHDAIAAPEFHRTWWDAYVSVNRRFAEAASAAADPGARVWVQDYQLQLVPGMLRELRDDLHIGYFHHIPFPAREIFLRLPWRHQIIEGLLGADVIGFQTQVMAHNFRHVVPRLTHATVTGKRIHLGDRTILADVFPIGIDVGHYDELARSPLVAQRVDELRHAIGDPEIVLLGVDRLDYTKGISVRLRAILELLDERRLDPERTALVQIAQPSRSNVIGYADIRHEVERLVGEINGNFGGFGRPVVHYFHQGMPSEDIVALYRLADVMVVTPFRDGMNLVAKEYVAARTDGTGALVLSEFAGASQELREAILVNPYDIDGLKRSIELAVTMAPDEQRRRMRSLRRIVRRQTAQRWSRTFLEALE